MANVAITYSQLQTSLTRVKNEIDTATANVAVYTMVKQATADSGYAATYYMTKDNVQTGVKINIPKDYLVKSASLKTVTTANSPYSGAAVGDKYIDFTVNTVSTDGTESHIYLAVNDLVDVYTGGNGIAVSSGNVISITVNSSVANGLSTTSSGLQLALATTTAAGAMSASDKEKLDNITFATDSEVTAMINNVFA